MRGKLLLPQFHSRNCASWNQGQLSTVPVCLPVHTILSLPFYNTWPELFTLLHSSAGKMVSKCLPYSFNPRIAYYERFVSCIQQRIPSQNRFGGTIYSILSHQKGPMKLPMKELLSIIKSSNRAREAQWIRITFKDVLTFSKGKTQKTKGKCNTLICVLLCLKYDSILQHENVEKFRGSHSSFYSNLRTPLPIIFHLSTNRFRTFNIDWFDHSAWAGK